MFFKKHLSKKDKKLAQLRIAQIGLAIVLGLMFALMVIVEQVHKDERRRNALHEEASHEAPDQTVPPGSGKIGGGFNLTDQNGKAVTDADYGGKYLLVYFGYTYCPDMCPTGLQSIAHAIDQLGNASTKVQSLFITIDPARDTPDKLKEYTSSFHPSIVGLTGTADQIAAVAREYQVYYKKGEQVDEKDYVMDHSSLIYLMDPHGHFITTFNEEVDPKRIVKALKDEWSGKKKG